MRITLLRLCNTARRKEARFTLLKGEGNDLVKRGRFQEALQKYDQCLSLKPEECALYTNRWDKQPRCGYHVIIPCCRLHTRRAICFLRLNRFQEARQDCDCALRLEPSNRKAFYRRALAHKGLQVPSGPSDHNRPLLMASVLTRLLFRGQDYLSASSDLQEVLQLDPNVREAEQELETVTRLLRRSLLEDSGETPAEVLIHRGHAKMSRFAELLC